MNMDPDITLVVGIVLAVLAIPSIVSAFSDSRSPRVATLVVVIGGGLMIYAITTKEGGYRIKDVPPTIYRVIAQFL